MTDPAFYRVRELIQEWAYHVRRDNCYETMYSRQPFIDGQGVQRIVPDVEPWPDLVQVIDGIIRTMPRVLRGPVWMKFIYRYTDHEAAHHIGQSKSEYRNRIDRAIWYAVGRIDD